MKIHKKLLSLLLVLCVFLGMTGTSLAADYSGDAVVPGLSGIQPGDTLTHPDNTDWATLKASWGVRVTFIDYDNSEIKTEVIPVTDNTPGNTSAPADPSRSGYTFTGWERYDANGGTAALNDDGSVSEINGPGPIIFIAKYTKNTAPAPAPDPKPDTGSLTVTKAVEGEGADTSKAFKFTVILDDDSINGHYGDMNFKNGKASFELKDGESTEAEKLPAGIKYTVKEADYSSEGYTASKTGDSGTITKGKTLTAEFTNTFKKAQTPADTDGNKPVQTGDSSQLMLYILLLVINMAALTAAVIYRRKIN